MPGISAPSAIIIVLAAVILILLFRRKLNTQSNQKPEAQRFATLLIAEIKLYNQQKLESGHDAGNIYQQLKPDIDGARKMYDERTPLHEFNPRDYFHEESVRNLAGGDETKLGPGYVKR